MQTSRVMRKFLLYIFAIAASLIIVDRAFGYANQYMMRRSSGGQTFCQNYVCFDSNEDIIMMGSSRMRHHYNPIIIEDSLGMTCYNAGEDGAGIILNYGYFKMITNRYLPKLIIYDVTNFDMYVGDDNSKYLGWLRKFYDEPGIKDIVCSVSKSEGLKNISYLYRYNTRCIATLADFIHPVRSYVKGYSPIEGILNYDPKQNNYDERVADSLKLNYLSKLIDEAKERGVMIVFLASPQYDTYEGNSYYHPVESLCEQKKVPFWNYFYCPVLSGNKLFFQDREHLNKEGSTIFTNMIVDRLKSLVE